MNKIKKIGARVEKFIEDHKFGLGFTAGAVAGIVLNRVVVKEHDDFLKEHGLYDEFYTATEE